MTTKSLSFRVSCATATLIAAVALSSTPTMAEEASASSPVAATAAPAAKKTNVKKKRKRISKKNKSARAPRQPASIHSLVALPTPDLNFGESLVFDESTSFQDIVAKKAQIDRAPAAIESMARVISVRRELGLTSNEAARAPQDIILNAGTAAGIEEGMTLAIVRKVPVLDPYRENQQAELEIEFGKIKIVHAQKDVAIARLDSMDPIQSGISVGTRAVLVGDFVTRTKR